MAANGETSCCINLKPHDMQLVQRTWQTTDRFLGIVLQHTDEKMVCKKCGLIVDAFEKKD